MWPLTSDHIILPALERFPNLIGLLITSSVVVTLKRLHMSANLIGYSKYLDLLHLKASIVSLFDWLFIISLCCCT